MEIPADGLLSFKAFLDAHETPLTLTAKDTNPKDAVGTGKVPISTVPAQVIAECGLAMLEGARKYGRHNYRVAGVRASVYYDAAMRHLMAWFEGQDIDPDSGLPHIVKALASLIVLRDAQINDKCTDDRPPSMADVNWIAGLNKTACDIIARYPDAKAPYVRERSDEQSNSDEVVLTDEKRVLLHEHWEGVIYFLPCFLSDGRFIGSRILKPGTPGYKAPPSPIVEHCSHGVNLRLHCDDCAQNRHTA